MLLFSANLVIFLLLLVYGNGDEAPSVIIIGAGAAGIAAASKLLESGVGNVTILEAEGRLGGRIHTVDFGSSTIDLGAEWCEGEEHNVVYELVKDFNLLEPTQFSPSRFSSSRKGVDPNLAQEFYALCEAVYNGEKSEDVSLGQYFIDKYNKTISEKYGNDSEKLKLAWEVLNTYKYQVLSIKGAFSWFDLAAKNSKEIYEGNQFMNWKGRGFKTVLDVLMKSYPDQDKKLPIEAKTVFNKEVIEIKWDAEPAADHDKVTVRCSDDSEYTANHVILTVSLGVLKDQYDTLFNPALPQEKINAIEELGIGAVTKVFLHFPQRWWPDSNLTNNFILHWHENDREKLLTKFPNGPNDNGQSWLGDLNGFISVEENPNVLAAWFSGEFIPQIELISDDMIVDGLMFILNEFMGHQFNVSRPDKILRYNWYSNLHFRGVCSFETVKSRKRAVPGAIALSKPLTSSSGRTVLLFAGEATNPIHYANVHGAIETGFREADRIINLYK